MAENDVIKLKTVPVTLLKRRKRVGKDIIKQQRVRAEEIRKRAKKRRSQIRPPVHFIRRSIKRTQDQLRLERLVNRKPPILSADYPKLGVVIRLKQEVDQVSNVCKNVFRLLRLDTYNQAVFIKVTEATLELLNIASPHIAWGYPSIQVVRDMVMKRGRTMLGRHKHSIDNKIIEEKLGYCGILCLEDIIHELVTIGPNFKAVQRFLCPFKLMPSSRDWMSGSRRCHARSDFLTAFREEQINEMIRRMI
ncbi:unnamed protein product [Trichobilharzia szidati]|nr:unnamed protein product [Trichobilharzia szidati]CAH8833660.1 unnamed protein product [Trichobilharzia szidati]